MAFTQAAFVVGSVFLKGSLQLVDAAEGERFHPVVFAFAREASAGPILFAIAWTATGVAAPARQDAGRLVALGACLFASQLFYIIGIELSGVAAASCMQPAIPVFTALMGIGLGMEAASPQKLAGIALAATGAVCMVMGGLAHAPPAAAGALGPPPRFSAAATGNACLLANTMAMACYYILAKRAVAKYPPAAVAAWAYLVGEWRAGRRGVHNRPARRRVAARCACARSPRRPLPRAPRSPHTWRCIVCAPNTSRAPPPLPPALQPPR